MNILQCLDQLPQIVLKGDFVPLKLCTLTAHIGDDLDVSIVAGVFTEKNCEGSLVFMHCLDWEDEMSDWRAIPYPRSVEFERYYYSICDTWELCRHRGDKIVYLPEPHLLDSKVLLDSLKDRE